jgi:hypothetical protein
MMSDEIWYPCVCGHALEITHTIKSSDGKFPCFARSHVTHNIDYICECHDFKLDNLTYIEIKAREKNLI